jgi:hypothetical protein
MTETEKLTHSSDLLISELFVILETYHERELGKLQEIRAGLPDINRGLLEENAMKLLTVSPNRTEYLKLLTQQVMAMLDGGDSPVLLHFLTKPVVT